MSDGPHPARKLGFNFCAVPGEPCKPCGNNYRKVCKPPWSNLEFAQRFTETDKATGIKTITARERSYEAHHILCLAQVKKVIVKESEKNDFTDIVDSTKWCINAKRNMIALPMWGHTITWYCNSFSSIARKSTFGRIADTTGDKLKIPPFKNLPQHNYGHSGRTTSTSYNREVEDRLGTVVEAVEEAKDKHLTEQIATLQDKLNTLSDEFRDKLKGRAPDTHAAWLKGRAHPNDPICDWYKSFSMAEEARPMTFPGGSVDSEMGQKIQRLAQALWNMVK